MQDAMNMQMLREESASLSPALIEAALGPAHAVYRAFREQTNDLVHDWRYYKDGAAWLCKISLEKHTRTKIALKTVAWVSIWSGFFKIGFYFTERSGSGIETLDIDEAIKEQYRNARPIGKLRPLTIDVRTRAQLPDALALIRYKRSQL